MAVVAELLKRSTLREATKAARQREADEAATIAAADRNIRHAQAAERARKIEAEEPAAQALGAEGAAILVSHGIRAPYQLTGKYESPRMFGWPLYYTTKATGEMVQEKTPYGDEGYGERTHLSTDTYTYLGPDGRVYDEREAARGSKAYASAGMPLETWRIFLQKYLVESIEAKQPVAHQYKGLYRLTPSELERVLNP